MTNRFYGEHFARRYINFARAQWWRWKAYKAGPYTQSIYGPRFSTNYRDATFRYYISGAYGFFLADVIAGIDSSFYFIDIGANQGLYSVLAALNPKCERIYSFEPVPDTFRLLQQNIAVNGCGPKVLAINSAITDRAGAIDIHLRPDHSGGASLEARTYSERISITSVCGADLAQLINIPSDAQVFIKIDTEGHEPTVVRQLRSTCLWRNVRAIYLEMDANWFDVPALLGSLNEDGFHEAGRSGMDDSHFDVLLRRNSG